MMEVVRQFVRKIRALEVIPHSKWRKKAWPLICTGANIAVWVLIQDTDLRLPQFLFKYHIECMVSWRKSSEIWPQMTPKVTALMGTLIFMFVDKAFFCWACMPCTLPIILQCLRENQCAHFKSNFPNFALDSTMQTYNAHSQTECIGHAGTL